jgi:mannitol-1-phosphate/altronate dehydrogenase
LPFHHVHLGAGALGLGLICPIVVEAGGKCTILNRASPGAKARLEAINERRGYHIFPYEDERAFVDVIAAVSYDDADLPALAGADGDLLLTTALRRDGIIDSLAVIREILEERGTRPTVVLAGENQVDTLFLRDQLIQGGFQPDDRTLFVRGVVDRICNKPTLEEDGLEVTCEAFARIYVEKVQNFFIRALAKPEHWEVVTDIQFVVDRKKWIVNASHLLMTLVAHYFRQPSVKSFVSQEFGQRLLDKAVAEFTTLMIGHYGLTGRGEFKTQLIDFAPHLTARIASFPQRYPEVVTRFDGPEKLPAFFEDFHRKITELTLEKMHRAATAPYFASLVTHIVVDLIKDKRWIRDAKSDVTITPSAR